MLSSFNRAVQTFKDMPANEKATAIGSVAMALVTVGLGVGTATFDQSGKGLNAFYMAQLTILSGFISGGLGLVCRSQGSRRALDEAQKQYDAWNAQRNFNGGNPLPMSRTCAIAQRPTV